MAKTREIKKRIKAVANIRRITKTMQMIATAKFAASQQRSVAGRPYTDTLFELVAQLASAVAGSGQGASHPLLQPKADVSGAKELTLIITSDRGLCGPYNGSILRTAMGFFRQNAAAKGGLVEVSGKKGVGFLKYAGIPIAQQHTIGDKPSIEAVQAIAQDYIRRFVSGEVSRVRVVYMKFLSASRQAPMVVQLLPFEAPQGTKAASAAGINPIYAFDPSPQELLDSLLPAAVRQQLYQAFNDAVVSENVARMVAMKSATDNAGKMGKLYTRKFNRARQAQITTELTEIISGAAALE